jgi:hypothetical protein
MRLPFKFIVVTMRGLQRRQIKSGLWEVQNRKYFKDLRNFVIYKKPFDIY